MLLLCFLEYIQPNKKSFYFKKMKVFYAWFVLKTFAMPIVNDIRSSGCTQPFLGSEPKDNWTFSG